MYIDNNLVQRMKNTYPPGTRIELDYMGDDPRPISPGTKGTVKLVDDIGTVHCIFDSVKMFSPHFRRRLLPCHPLRNGE